MLKFIQPGKITFNAPRRREKDVIWLELCNKFEGQSF